MEDRTRVLNEELRYAERMVRTGFITPQQAARTCAVLLPALQTLLGESAVCRVPPPSPRSLQSLDTWVPV